MDKHNIFPQCSLKPHPLSPLPPHYPRAILKNTNVIIDIIERNIHVIHVYREHTTYSPPPPSPKAREPLRRQETEVVPCEGTPPLKLDTRG